jgi:hypothetical protein
MDAAALRERIAATLDANADVRRQAELSLKYVRKKLLYCYASLEAVE